MLSITQLSLWIFILAVPVFSRSAHIHPQPLVHGLKHDLLKARQDTGNGSWASSGPPSPSVVGQPDPAGCTPYPCNLFYQVSRNSFVPFLVVVDIHSQYVSIYYEAPTEPNTACPTAPDSPAPTLPPGLVLSVDTALYSVLSTDS